jgi:hypothetical protein
MNDQWYLSRDNTQYGPYTWEKIYEMFHTGHILGHDQLWNQNTNTWIRADQIPELRTSPQQAQVYQSAKTGFLGNKTTLTVSLTLVALLILGSVAYVLQNYLRRPTYYAGIRRVSTAKLPEIVSVFPERGPVGSKVYLQFDQSVLDQAENLTAWYGQKQVPLTGISEDIVQVDVPIDASSGSILIKSDKASSKSINFTVDSLISTPLISQEVQPSNQMQTISYKDEVSVTFPPGFLDKPRKLSISKLENTPASPMEPFGSSIAYDISIDGMEQLPDYIKVSMKYTPDDVDPDHPAVDQLTMMRWNDEFKNWEIIPSQLNETQQSIDFITNHLTPLKGFFAWPTKIAVVKTAAATVAVIGATVGGLYIAERLCFTSYITPQGNFKLYYNKKVWDVFEKYSTWQKPSMASGLASYNPKHPNYIQDIGEVMETAFKNYIGKGYKNPVDVPGRIWGTWHTPITVKISGVWSTLTKVATGEEDPQYGKLFGALHFPARLFMNMSSNPDKAYTAIAHELFHRFQAEYYGRRSFLKSSIGTGDYWWIESSAEYASCMEAWGTVKYTHFLEEGFKPDFLDYPITSTGLKGPLWTRDYEYASAAFIRYLVEQKGLKFKDMFEMASKGSALSQLDAYVRSVNPDDRLGYYYAYFANWAVFSNTGILKNSGLASFKDDVSDRTMEIAEKKDTLSLNEKEAVKIELNNGRAWVDVLVLPEGSKFTGNTYVNNYVLTDEVNIPAKNIKPGDVLYLLASNTRTDDDQTTITVKVDKPDGDELSHTFSLPGNHSAKLWAIKLDKSEVILTITPNDIPDGKAEEEYSFELKAEGIAKKITEVDFEWDFGDGESDSKDEQKGESVKQGKAEIEITHTYKKPPPKCTITAIVKDSKTGEELAKTTANIAFGINVTILGGNVEYELQKDEKEYKHTFEAKADPPGEYRYEWSFGDSKTFSDKQVAGQNSKATNTFKDGFYTTEVKLYDVKTGDMLASNQVMVTIIQDLKKYDLKECDQWSVAQSGGYGTTLNLWDISALPEGAKLDLSFDAYSMPDRFVVQYKGVTVFDSGWRGDGSYAQSKPSLYPGGISGPGKGTADNMFSKAGDNTIRVIVYGPEGGTAWNYKIRARCSS